MFTLRVSYHKQTPQKRVINKLHRNVILFCAIIPGQISLDFGPGIRHRGNTTPTPEADPCRSKIQMFSYRKIKPHTVFTCDYPDPGTRYVYMCQVSNPPASGQLLRLITSLSHSLSPVYRYVYMSVTNARTEMIYL